MHYLSKKYAIKTLKKLFSGTENDKLSFEEIVSAWGGRESFPKEKNASWLGNKMVHLKYYNLINPIYKHNENNRRVFEGIQLTLDGKKGLGRIRDGAVNDPEQHPSQNNIKASTTSLRDVMKTISTMKEEFPEYEITFDMKLKSGGVDTNQS